MILKTSDTKTGEDMKIHLDPKEQRLIYGDTEILMRGGEFKLLAALYNQKGNIVERRSLHRLFFNEATRTNIVDVYIYRVRKILEKHKIPLRIINRHGMGFKVVTIK